MRSYRWMGGVTYDNDDGWSSTGYKCGVLHKVKYMLEEEVVDS